MGQSVERRGGYRDTVNLPPFFSVPIDSGLLDRLDLDLRVEGGRPKVQLEAVADMNETLAIRFHNERVANNQAKRQADAARKSKRGR